MNIVKENVDNLNAVIKVSIEAADYAESVESKLKDHRKNAQVKGFRQGKKKPLSYVMFLRMSVKSF